MTDDNVTSFGGETKLPVSIDKVLAGALEAHEAKPFDRVIVIGMYENNSEEYFAASESDAGANYWDAGRFQYMLMKRAEERINGG